MNSFSDYEQRRQEQAKEEAAARKKIHKVVALIIAGVAAFIVAFNSFTIVPTGYVGVKTTFGQISKNTLSPGFNIKAPFVQGIRKVNIKQQDAYFEGQIWSETSDMTELYYDQITVTYQIHPDQVAWILSNVSDYKNSLVSVTALSSAVKNASRQLDSKEATNRGKIEPLIQQALQDSLDEKYGQQVVTIARIVVGDANFEDSYNQAIAARQKSKIEAEQQAVENQKAIDKAEADAKVAKTQAEADAEVKKVQAQANADAKLIEAEAEAKANEKINSSLTDKVLRQQYIDKWNGELPKVTSDDTTMMMEIPSETKTDSE